MRAIIETVAMVIVVVFVIGGLVWVASAKEPTALEDAINRPTVIVRIVDRHTGTVCFFNKRFPQYMSCVRDTRYFFKGIESGEIVVESEDE